MIAHPNRGGRRTYFLLVERDNALAPWSAQFGAWDRGDVAAERQDRRDHGAHAINLRIIGVRGGKQRTIDEAIARLNTATSVA